METTCGDVCEAVCDHMCLKCQYFKICQKLDPDDGGLTDEQVHEQMIECIANGFKPEDWDEQKKGTT